MFDFSIPPSCQAGFAARLLALSLMAAVCCGCSKEANSVPEAAITSSAPVVQEKVPSETDTRHPKVRIQTSIGAIVVKLDAEKAPGTVRNFLDYVVEDFYSGTLIHFVDPGKMVLGGGYTVDGELKDTRLSILNEAHNGLQNKRGTIAMARNPEVTDSATTQFFINLVDAPTLDHVDDLDNYGYCVFGTVIEGMDVAEQISHVPTQDRGGDLFQSPQKPVVIESVDLM